MAKAEGDTAALGAITEEKEDGGMAPGSKGETTPEIVSRRSLPKMAVSFGKKTKEKLTIKTSSEKAKPPTKTLVNGSGDISETEENGDLAHELTPASMSENGSEISTPVNLRKSSGSNIELEPSRSMQVSSV